MPRLYRYIIGETASAFIATCIILLAIVLSFRLSNLLSTAATGDMTLGAVGQLILLQAIRFLVILMPLAFVLAATMTLGRLYRDHEISAMFAGGIGYSQLLKALLLLALPIALTLAALTLIVLPDIYQRQDSLRQQAQQEASMVLFTPNTFRQLSDNTIVHIKAKDNSTLIGFFIAQQQNNEHSVIFADTGAIKQDSQQRYLELYHGQRLAWQTDLAPENISIGQFSQATLRLPSTTINHSSRLRNQPTHSLDHSPPHQGERQARLNPVIALLVFSLVLPLLSQVQPRQGRYQKILPAFLLFALYINCLDALVALVKKSKIAVYPGSYSLHLAVLLIIAWFWWRQQKGQFR